MRLYMYVCVYIFAYICMYIHVLVLTQCCTSQPMMSHKELCMMWVPLAAALHFSYRAGLQSEVGVHVDPSRRNSRFPAMLYPSAILSTFALTPWACFSGWSTGSCKLCFGHWQSLQDCAVSQQYVSASGWSMKKPEIKRRVLRHVPSAHCKILFPALSTFHPSRRALRHWCIRAMRRREVPSGPERGRPARTAFLLSKTGIMPTTSQLPGSARTSSCMQPRDTAEKRCADSQ